MTEAQLALLLAMATEMATAREVFVGTSPLRPLIAAVERERPPMVSRVFEGRE